MSGLTAMIALCLCAGLLLLSAASVDAAECGAKCAERYHQLVTLAEESGQNIP
jgi:hypothetical protein